MCPWEGGAPGPGGGGARPGWCVCVALCVPSPLPPLSPPCFPSPHYVVCAFNFCPLACATPTHLTCIWGYVWYCMDFWHFPLWEPLPPPVNRHYCAFLLCGASPWSTYYLGGVATHPSHACSCLPHEGRKGACTCGTACACLPSPSQPLCIQAFLAFPSAFLFLLPSLPRRRPLHAFCPSFYTLFCSPPKGGGGMYVPPCCV